MYKVSGVCKVLITSRVRLSDTLSRPLPLSPLLPHHVHDHLSLSIPLPSSSLRTTIISLSPSLYHHPLYAPRSSLSLHPSTIIFSTHHDHLSLSIPLPSSSLRTTIISLSPSLYHHLLYAPRSSLSPPLLPRHVHDHLSLSIPLPSSSLRTTILSSSWS